MARKRTEDDVVDKLNEIHELSIAIVTSMVRNPPCTNQQLQKVLRDAKRVTTMVDDMKRTDRCWYCYTRTKELGTDTVYDVCQCIACAGERYGVRLTQTHELRDRLVQGYML